MLIWEFRSLKEWQFHYGAPSSESELVVHRVSLRWSIAIAVRMVDQVFNQKFWFKTPQPVYELQKSFEENLTISARQAAVPLSFSLPKPKYYSVARFHSNTLYPVRPSNGSVPIVNWLSSKFWKCKTFIWDKVVLQCTAMNAGPA